MRLAPQSAIRLSSRAADREPHWTGRRSSVAQRTPHTERPTSHRTSHLHVARRTSQVEPRKSKVRCTKRPSQVTARTSPIALRTSTSVVGSSQLAVTGRRFQVAGLTSQLACPWSHVPARRRWSHIIPGSPHREARFDSAQISEVGRDCGGISSKYWGVRGEDSARPRAHVAN